MGRGRIEVTMNKIKYLWFVVASIEKPRYREDIHVTRYFKNREILAGPFKSREDARQAKYNVCNSLKLTRDLSFNDDVIWSS